jgi:GDSL-like Lipase/Acylhydrolase family
MLVGPLWNLWGRGRAADSARPSKTARAGKRHRAFKRLIVLVTAAVAAALILATPYGRITTARLAHRGRMLWERLMGLPPDRSLQAEFVRAERLRIAEAARLSLAETEVAKPGSPMDVFLHKAGMDARTAVVRWGNVDQPIVLSSAVYEPDDERAYRLKPGVRSVWVVGFSFRKSLAMFLIPDTPEARQAAGAAGGRVVPESVQTTNSWGCRGPEPDTSAPVRVMVLGDSMMQGTLVGDADTPPVRLEAHLAQALAAPVSVLNTGHVGYSPEQYDGALRAFHDRFRPQYVVVSFADNDFGELEGRPDWVEAEYWIDRITAFCMQRGVEVVYVPAPTPQWLLGRRQPYLFQAPIARVVKRGGRNFVDPTESFTDALLRMSNEQTRTKSPQANPLFNLHLMGDRHFSPAGADLWARIVARRMLLSWDRAALSGQSCPEAVVRHAKSAHPMIPSDESD